MTGEAPTPTYRPLDARTVLDYARPDLAAPPTRAAEIGDGNLNLVFRVVAADGASVIVKQALPYARVVGPGWPLTLERAGIEARALAIQGDLCPGLVPALHRYDPAMAALVMEDLAGHVVLRRRLIAGRVYPRAPEALGRFCARMALGTSDLLLGPRPSRRRRPASRIRNSAPSPSGSSSPTRSGTPWGMPSSRPCSRTRADCGGTRPCAGPPIGCASASARGGRRWSTGTCIPAR